MVYLVLGLTMLFGAGYAAAAVVAGDRVPHGTTVAGIDIGGRSPQEAVDALRAGLSPRADAPFTVVVDGRPVRVTPRQAGLAVDYVASVHAAVSPQSWSPDHVWGYYSGGDAHDPVVTLDQLRLRHLVHRLDREAGRPAIDGSVSFVRGTVVVSQPIRGREVDLQQAADALTSAYLTDAPTIALPLRTTTPTIGQRDVRRAVRTFANPAVSAGVTLTFGRARVRLQPRDYASSLGMVADAGRLRPVVHRDRLRTVLDSISSARGTAQDASIRIVGGHPVVVPGTTGVRFHARQVAPALLAVVRRPEGRRSVRVPARITHPHFTTHDAHRLGVRERVGSWTTTLPRGHAGHGDLLAAVSALRGTIVKPGHALSLNHTVPAYSSRSVSALGEALFNAAYVAGLAVDEQHPSRTYDGTGPMGRTVRVAWPQADVRFTDDTDHGLFVQVRLDPPSETHNGSVTVVLWSTQVWNVSVSHSDRSHVTHGGVRMGHGAHCRPRSGRPGFDVDVDRAFQRPGSSDVDHTDTLHVHYDPVTAVRCVR